MNQAPAAINPDTVPEQVAVETGGSQLTGNPTLAVCSDARSFKVAAPSYTEVNWRRWRWNTEASEAAGAAGLEFHPRGRITARAFRCVTAAPSDPRHRGIIRIQSLALAGFCFQASLVSPRSGLNRQECVRVPAAGCKSLRRATQIEVLHQQRWENTFTPSLEKVKAPPRLA